MAMANAVHVVPPTEMQHHANELSGTVALVIAGFQAERSELFRASALQLAARGAAVIVNGSDERALGEIVGEIAFGGGRARHVVGAVGSGCVAETIRNRSEEYGDLDAVLFVPSFELLSTSSTPQTWDLWVAQVSSAFSFAHSTRKDHGAFLVIVPADAPSEQAEHARVRMATAAIQELIQRSPIAKAIAVPFAKLASDDAADEVTPLLAAAVRTSRKTR